ncbi:MAG: nucleotidyltransferase family protein [Erythrobacter sp.]|uniref:nucleotidyltransferase family protein n=1 Tax=Erythrobacter sp. TaxID=1042 RepID=UPI002600D6BF|nr:nucleotidyltransferase family protein [Erythrobacter sp.]MCL9998593.1 nucleotidyltransferase family protein [Erythrobacter sp.]
MRPSEAYGWIAHWLIAEHPCPPPPDCDWNLVMAAASHHLVTPALAFRLQGQERVPQETADYLDAVLYLNRERNAQLADGLALVCDWFAQAGLDPLLIKGASLVASGCLPDPGVRMMGDLDVVLPDEAQLQAARALMEQRGFRFAPAPRRPSHQLGMATHDELALGVELHRRMISPAYAHALGEPDIWARSECVPLGSCMVRVPMAQHRMAIAIAHGQMHDRGHVFGHIGLRSLQDIGLHLRLPDGESAYRAAIDDLLSRDQQVFAPAGPMVDWARGPPGAMPPALRGALDDRWARWRKAGMRLAQTLPAFFRLSAAQQREALQPQRWRDRMGYHFRRW